MPYRRNIICREIQVNSYNVASSIWPCGQPVRGLTGNCPRRKPIFYGIVFSGRMSLFDPRNTIFMQKCAEIDGDKTEDEVRETAKG